LLDAEQIKQRISASLTCQIITVEGDGRHFFATIVSDAFNGYSRLRQHQIVYQALGNSMQHDIHALSMKTLTPTEWEQRAQQAGKTAGADQHG
jgi:acid stress-induced BolA-like protein IbaG/YrbA